MRGGIEGLPRELLRLAPAETWAAGVVLIAAHPDDETIGAGGVLPHLPLRALVHVTDGAPADRRWWGDPSLASRPVYAAVRRAELACALSLAGIGADRVACLGREDQRAAHDLPGLAADVESLLDVLRPGVVLTHPYEGGHPDHDAAAFAVHSARDRLGDAAPVIVEFTSYHASAEGIATGSFLPSQGDAIAPFAVREGGLRAVVAATLVANPQIPSSPEARVPLSADDRDRKRRMMECFGTQGDTLAQFAVGDSERFRIAPAYDFTRPPHEGTLNYERFDWGITGDAFQANAAEALETLGLGGAVRC